MRARYGPVGFVDGRTRALRHRPERVRRRRRRRRNSCKCVALQWRGGASHRGPGVVAVHVDDRVLHQGHRDARGAEGVRTGRDGRLDLGRRDRSATSAGGLPAGIPIQPRGSGRHAQGVRGHGQRVWWHQRPRHRPHGRAAGRRRGRPGHNRRERAGGVHQGHRGQQAVHRALVDRRVRRFAVHHRRAQDADDERHCRDERLPEDGRGPAHPHGQHERGRGSTRRRCST